MTFRRQQNSFGDNEMGSRQLSNTLRAHVAWGFSCRLKQITVIFSILTIALSFVSISVSLSSKNPDSYLVTNNLSFEPQRPLRTSLPKGKSAANCSRNLTEYTDVREEPQFAIFYNIFIPQRRDYENAIAIVKEQINQFQSTYAASLNSKPVTVYYNTVGLNILNSTHIEGLCSKQGNIVCQFMDHYSTGFEERTLQKVYDYCHKHENHRVVYIHDKGSYHPHPSGFQDPWRRHGTMAAMSEQCIRPANETCNVCGLLWYPVPWPHMPGNFWAAHCSYIKQLIPPTEYKKRKRVFYMNRKLKMEKQENIILKLFPSDDPVYTGNKRYALEQWVGSHPSVVPCDLSVQPDIQAWKGKDRNGTEFAFAMAPRHSFRTMLNVAAVDLKLIQNDFDRFRDYFLLAGTILRWQALYKAVPPHSSWIWSFYPDGNVWREAVDKYGDRAVDVLTAKYKDIALAAAHSTRLNHIVLHAAPI